MKRPFFIFACGVLLAFTPAPADIHIGDPYVRVALEDYVKFSAKPAEVSEAASKTTPSRSIVRDSLKPAAGIVASELVKVPRD